MQDPHPTDSTTSATPDTAAETPLPEAPTADVSASHPVSKPASQPSPVSRDHLALPAGGAGAERGLEVLRFGTPGARPKVYLQAGLHADELPGMLVLREIALRLQEEAAHGKIVGEIVVVPVANPIGLAQHGFGVLQGRFETESGENFNRGYPDLAPAVAQAVSGQIGPDPVANVAAIRAAMQRTLAGMTPEGALDTLRHHLLALACDADIVLDLHADNQALVHMYTGTALWPDAQDLAAELDARAVLLCALSGGNPFDEACSGPWWALAEAFPDQPIPPACLSVTVELRSNNDVAERLVRDDAMAILSFLRRRGALAGEAGVMPRLLCVATPLEAMQQVIAPVEGIVLYHARLGDTIRDGDLIATIVDPLGDSTEVRAHTEGVLFARHDQPFAWPGKVIGKIAGATPLPERTGNLLTD
ncbi:succinylglutamate desuccinylase/aspartoacylase family protein [Tropicimonas sp. IMCC34043]|uniref:succinylglutamate desuccinylase/aspartoacylase family protein n=1 Tax=Tropicimonas sp. IMCC34043 TaxID=2248760 RepID=UPI000E2704DB|nr:succinylglutamate desuccinylase/aspartoacylase family protein [Tropicimonas sp. IMCC34043]